MKKLFGWVMIAIYFLSVVFASVIAILQTFAIMAIRQGMTVGYTSKLVANNFPLNTISYYAGYAMFGIILLSMFHKWIFPEEHTTPTGNHYR